jgi:predicted nucleic acid-binding protein
MNTAEKVVDASLALKWVMEEPYSAEARTLLERWRDDQQKLTAPALFIYEITNALAKRVQRRNLTPSDAKQKLAFFLALGPTLSHLGGLHFRALEIAEKFKMSAAYDAHYLALAESRSCECWTADERLWNTVKAEFPWVRWIGGH